MGPKRISSKNFSPFIVKFKKLGFSAPLMALIFNEPDIVLIFAILSSASRKLF